MVCSVEEFGGQSNEQFSPVEDQEESFPWKSWSPVWLPSECEKKKGNSIGTIGGSLKSMISILL